MPYRLKNLHHLGRAEKRYFLFRCRLLKLGESCSILLAHFVYIWRDLPFLLALIRDGDKHPYAHWLRWMHSPRRQDRRPVTIQEIAIDATIIAGIVIPVLALVK